MLWAANDMPLLRPHDRRRRALAHAALAGAVLLGVGACADEADDATSGGPDAGSFRARAALACTDVLNDRGAAFTAGRVEMLDAVVILRGGDELGADAVDLESVRDVADELAVTRERLALVDTDDATDAEITAWDEVVGAVDQRIASVGARVVAVEAADATAITASFETIEPVSMPEDALATLAMTGRDCELLLEGDGVGGDPFAIEASTACARAVQVGRDRPTDDDEDLVLGLVAAVVTGDEVQVTDEVVGAVDRLAARSRAVAEVLSSVVPPGDHAAHWATLMAGVDGRLAVAEARAEALADGSDTAIAEAFTPDGSLSGSPSDDERQAALDAIGIGHRDCRSIG
jgi:hypothetical protein